MGRDLGRRYHDTLRRVEVVQQNHPCLPNILSALVQKMLGLVDLTTLCLPNIPSPLVSLLLPELGYSMSGCSKSFFTLSPQPSDPADNSPWRTSPFDINLRFSSETQSGHA